MDITCAASLSPIKVRVRVRVLTRVRVGRVLVDTTQQARLQPTDNSGQASDGQVQD